MGGDREVWCGVTGVKEEKRGWSLEERKSRGRLTAKLAQR